MSQLPELIGVCGRKYSGKDTLGKHLVEEYDYERYAFADKIKEAVWVLNPVVDHTSSGLVHLQQERRAGEQPLQTVDRLKLEEGEVRRLLQAMGHDVGQKMFGSTFWIDIVLQSVTGKKAVITDVRYPHEAEAVREVGGKVIRVLRPGTDNSGDTHDSERLVDECKVDCEVVNDRTITDYLHDAVEALRGC